MPQTQQQQSPNNLILRQKCSAAKRSKRAKSSLRSRISSSAVHWADNDVNPQISANNMLKRKKKMKKSNSLSKHYSVQSIVYSYSSLLLAVFPTKIFKSWACLALLNQANAKTSPASATWQLNNRKTADMRPPVKVQTPWFRVQWQQKIRSQSK